WLLCSFVSSSSQFSPPRESARCAWPLRRHSPGVHSGSVFAPRCPAGSTAPDAYLSSGLRTCTGVTCSRLSPASRDLRFSLLARRGRQPVAADDGPFERAPPPLQLPHPQTGAL